MARKASGEECDFADADAQQWCLSGILCARLPIDHCGPAVNAICQAIRTAFPERWEGNLTLFNDNFNTTFDDIQKVLKEAEKYYDVIP